MSLQERIALEVYDKGFHWQGTVDAPQDITATKRHLGVSTASFSAAPDIDVRDALQADGAQVVVVLDGVPFVSGWVESDAGGVNPAEPITYEIVGHEVLLWDILGWPVPGNSLSNQNAAYWTRTAPAETVVKEALAANATRLGLPLTVAPNLARGASIEASLRFHPIIDRLHTQLLVAGIGFTVSLVEDTGLNFDVYQATTHTLPMDSASGVITGGTWKRTRPKVTRVIAGGAGEGTARELYGPQSATWEPAMLPRIIEGFVDARDSEDGLAVPARMEEKLVEGVASYDLNLELDSTDEFDYGLHWKPGDVVPLQPRPDVTINARIDEALLTADNGVRVRPVVGAGDDPTTQALMPLVEAVVALGRTARNNAVR